jgi:iron complex transport system substrate-binding protein
MLPRPGIPSAPRRALGAVASVVLLSAGCGSGDGGVPADRPDGLRIASLSPALTGTVVELGAGAAVVGRTPWCGGIDASVPVVGSLEECNLERLLAVRPGILLVQAAEVPPDVAAVARERGIDVHRWHLDTVADVTGMVGELGELLATRGVPGARESARSLLAGFAQSTHDPVAERGPTLLLFGVDPPMAFGRGTYPDELWRAMGGRNAVDAPGYPQLGAEDVVRLAPARTIVLGRAAPPEWLRRATHGPVVMLDAPFLLEPGARMLRDGPKALRSAAQEASP